MGDHRMEAVHTPPLTDMTDSIRHRIRQAVNGGGREVTLPIDDVLALCREADDLHDDATTDLSVLRETVAEMRAALVAFAEIGRRLRKSGAKDWLEVDDDGDGGRYLTTADFVEAAEMLDD